MSDGGVYVVDSSSFMDWYARYYPPDVFGGLVARVDKLVGTERFIAPALVREELIAVGTTNLNEWLESHWTMFVPVADVLSSALVVQGQFPGLRDPKAEYEEADAYVIALARMRNGIVVTQETAASEKRIPDEPTTSRMSVASSVFRVSTSSA